MLQNNCRDCKSEYATITGFRNREVNKQNEDIVFIEESAAIKFYGLADGQSGKSHCREGGLEVLKAVYHYVIHENIDQMLRREYTDEVQYEILRRANKETEKYVDLLLLNNALVYEEEFDHYYSPTDNSALSYYLYSSQQVERDAEKYGNDSMVDYYEQIQAYLGTQ